MIYGEESSVVRERRMTATEARIHFGEVLRHARTTGNAVIVERDGSEEVAIIPITEYRRLHTAKATKEALLEQMERTHALIRSELGDRTLTPVSEIIDEMRAERDAEIDAVR
jgi:prevent-host-death family protein